MLGREKVLRILRAALTASSADQTEVVFIGQDTALTRFANSSIHQNVAEENGELRVRVIFGKKIGVASTRDLSRQGIEEVVGRATTAAKLQAENSDFQTLPGPLPVRKVDGFVARTADCTPEARAEVVKVICARAVEKGLTAAGALSTTAYEVGVANSLGVEVYHQGTEASANTVIMSEDSSGYAAVASSDVAMINGEAMAEEAIGRALQGHNPIAIEPGEYEVILEEYAVADMLETLAYLGFGAKSLQDGTSFLTGKIGQKVAGENITVWDDGLAADGLPMPFDFEGVPKQRVALIENGTAKGVVYDSLTAFKEGHQSTGHALPAPNPFGPAPLNLYLQPGSASKDEMVKSIKRGLWVTRFWYTVPVHPYYAVVTGMTRDGTFLIENGRVVGPVKNLRFTQSYLEALSNVDMVGQATKLVRSEYFTVKVPALKVRKFQFVSTTEF